ncbi:MAG: MBL fold metallo-hydrolase [Leptospiraceae bacterium]|nr:MBL fold metallo-hydrolase [Leptospiraceae bacterium]
MQHFIPTIVLAIGFSACSASIDVAQYPAQPFHQAPVAQGTAKFSILGTARFETGEFTTYSGGSLWKDRQMDHAAVLVEHPRGTFLFDSGLGEHIDQQYERMPWWIPLIMSYTRGQSALSQLKSRQYDQGQIQFIIPSHLHWDHASGLPDFPDTKVWITPAELEYARQHGSPPAFLPEQYAIPADRWHIITFTNQPYENFAQSLDIFGDGAVVLVPLPGHSGGPVGMFLRSASGQRYFFIGDTTWVLEGVQIPATKQYFASRMADMDPEAIKATIVQVHRLQQKYPQLIIVPAHDHQVIKNLPQFPEFTP